LSKVTILETTLRDGSYTNNFSFSFKNTQEICKKLEDVGFEFIEIGHGLGMNASNSGYGKAKETDENYMIAADQILSKSKYGMFCIPGIANLSDIDLGSKHNMDFVRIGTDVTKVEDSENFIKKAKNYGMFVAANYMKSYAMEPEKFAEKVKLSEKYGADIVYIVDSAGGMFPDDIEKYYNAIRNVSEIPIGFHAHDNLGLSISNNLKAIDLGINFIDSSLQGLGRSSGNASTEVLVAVLKKLDLDTGINFLKLLEIGKNYIQPIVTFKGKMPLDIVGGFADFHSANMKKIIKISDKYDVNPAELMIQISKINKIDVKEDILENIAKNLPKDYSNNLV
jgi:4-hydroxy-2-oxovalerate aldolase